MDDYILSVLQAQGYEPQDRDADKVKERLAGETLAPNKMQKRETDTSDENTVENDSGEALHHGDMAEEKEKQDGALKKMLERMTPVTVDESRGSSVEKTYPAEYSAGNGTMGDFSRTEQNAGISGMGPEEFSMFFQRDARRYS